MLNRNTQDWDQYPVIWIVWALSSRSIRAGLTNQASRILLICGLHGRILGLMIRERHLLSIPFLTAPTISLVIDDTSSCPTAAQVFSHVVFESKWLTVGSSMVSNISIGVFHRWTSEWSMFGNPAFHTFSPHLERTGSEFSAHDSNHIRLYNTEAFPNRLEWGSILPGHLYHSRDITYSEIRDTLRWIS